MAFFVTAFKYTFYNSPVEVLVAYIIDLPSNRNDMIIIYYLFV